MAISVKCSRCGQFRDEFFVAEAGGPGTKVECIECVFSHPLYTALFALKKAEAFSAICIDRVKSKQRPLNKDLNAIQSWLKLSIDNIEKYGKNSGQAHIEGKS